MKHSTAHAGTEYLFVETILEVEVVIDLAEFNKRYEVWDCNWQVKGYSGDLVIHIWQKILYKYFCK